MKTYTQLVDEVLANVKEVWPWDLVERRQGHPDLLLLDVRESYEYQVLHIEGSTNVPRGILESACEYGYEDTVPELAAARDRQIVVMCRSGHRSVLAAHVLQQMGFNHVASLKTGVRGWNDYEQAFVDGQEQAVRTNDADAYFAIGPRPDQIGD